MEQNHYEIIPAWMRIKKEALDSFYQCNRLLTEYRKIVTSKKSDPRTVQVKSDVWVAFVSEMINLYLSNKSEIKHNSKTKTMYEELKTLELHQLDVGKLEPKKALVLFNKLESALYASGLLKIGLPKVDPKNAALEGIEDE